MESAKTLFFPDQGFNLPGHFFGNDRIVDGQRVLGCLGQDFFVSICLYYGLAVETGIGAM